MFIVYTMPNCPDCKNAKQLLETQGQAYEEKKAGEDFTRDDLLDLLGPVRSLPQVIYVDDMEDYWHVGGYKDLRNYFSDTGCSVRQIEFKGAELL